MKKTFIYALAVLLFTGCGQVRNQKTPSQKAMSVIFETDIGNDVDDALALDMLYKYSEAGKIKLLAISTNKESIYSAEFIDVLNTWYHHPDIPVGRVNGGIDCETDAKNYAQIVCEMQKDNAPAFKRSIPNNSFEESVKLYRRILAKQPDKSVTIISVGFSTNLSRLLDSKPDEFSPLTGKELVAKKVVLLSTMAGSFGEKPLKEYNIVKDIPAAKNLFAAWPTPINTAPFEIGLSVLYPGTSIENDFSWAPLHPVVEAYKAYLPMPYDRPTWDLIGVLYALDPDPQMMTVSPKGIISVDDEGFTHFTPDPAGKHTYLTATSEQAEKIRAYFISITTKPPKAYGKKL